MYLIFSSEASVGVLLARLRPKGGEEREGKKPPTYGTDTASTPLLMANRSGFYCTQKHSTLNTQHTNNSTLPLLSFTTHPTLVYHLPGNTTVKKIFARLLFAATVAYALCTPLPLGGFVRYLSRG